MTSGHEQKDDPRGREVASAAAPAGVGAIAGELVASAVSRGVDLTGDGGLLTELTRRVLQAALEAEMSAHPGYDKHAVAGRNGANSRNGSTPKTVTTEIGKVTVNVPRDREGTFEPQIVRKHQRRLAGFDEAVISLYAKGMTTGDIASHLSEVYDTSVSRDLVSRVTDQVLDEMRTWSARPLDAEYPVIIIDAIVMKVRDGRVANRPVYVAMGIDLDGHRDVLGMWIGPTGGEGAKQPMFMLADLRNRGILDVCIVCCDGLKGLPEAITATWPDATVQTCVVHMVRNTLRYVAKQHWQAVTKQLKSIYTAPNLAAAEAAFEDFAQAWQARYPAMIGMWRRMWPDFIPFLDFPPEIRTLIYTTNAIESLNARFRAVSRRRGHFPDDEAALKVLYLAIRKREPNRPNPTGRIHGWKAILNVLALTYGDRLGLN